MKKCLLLASMLLLATSSFCQWTPGNLKDEFGDATTEKYLVYSSKNASFTKEGRTNVSKTPLQVNIKVFKNPKSEECPHSLSFELLVTASGKTINSTTTYESKAELYVKLSNDRLVSCPLFATSTDLRVLLNTDEKELIDLLLVESKPIRCLIMIDSKHTIARYNFTIDPTGFTAAFNKQLAISNSTKPVILTSASMQELTRKLEVNAKDTTGAGIIHVSASDIQLNTKQNDDKPVYGVEQMPQFPGGVEEMLKFIRDNLRYPNEVGEIDVEGRVTIRFVVNRNGDVTDVTIIRGLEPSFDKEAIRIVKMMPRWIPGRQNGRNVPVYYTLPIVFKLQK